MEVGLGYQWYVLPQNIAPILPYAMQIPPEIFLEDPTIVSIVLLSKIHLVLPYLALGPPTVLLNQIISHLNWIQMCIGFNVFFGFCYV
jgi:hypothetical protein